MMRLAWMCRPRPELGRLPLGDRTRFGVRCDRLRPQPEHGIGVRGHVLGMLRRGGDLGISIGGVKTALISPRGTLGHRLFYFERDCGKKKLARRTSTPMFSLNPPVAWKS